MVAGRLVLLYFPPFFHSCIFVSELPSSAEPAAQNSNSGADYTPCALRLRIADVMALGRTAKRSSAANVKSVPDKRN